MKITLYGSSLCPRCHFARKILLEIAHGNQNTEIEEIDVVAHPLKTWSDGIRIFPALKIDDAIFSGIFLSRKKMETFIKDHAVIQ
jgi:glutaredoxin